MPQLTDRLILGSTFSAIEIYSLGGREGIALLEVNQKKNELAVVKQESFEGRETIFKEKRKAPIVLVINNEHVLQKEVPDTDANDKKLLYKAFPNINENDFYYEIWRHDTVSIITICRRDYVDKEIKGLQSHCHFYAVSLGICSLAALSKMLPKGEVYTNNQLLSLENAAGIISKASPEPVQYTINSIVIDNTVLLCFSAIVNIFFSNSTGGNIKELNIKLSEGFKQKAIFEKGLIAGIGIILFLLLVNFFVFSYYFEKVNAAHESAESNKSTLLMLKNTRDRIKDKEKKLANFTANATSRSSLLLNDIAKTVPTTILLSELDYHPLEKNIKEGEIIKTADSLIIVKGQTLKNEDLSGWIENIQKLEKVKDVIITSFEKESTKNSSFSLTVTLK